jgi:tRNA(Ile)-lysidine synthase
LRNRVRQRLLPLLEDLRPGATQALARTAALAADERAWLDPLVATALDATRLDPEALAALPVALARRVVRAAARQAGEPVPDAAATDRILGRPAD